MGGIDSLRPVSVPTLTTGPVEVYESIQRALLRRLHEDNEDLIKTFFGVEISECNSILQKLADRGLWSSETKSWLRLPTDPKTDTSLHLPFIEIGNAVAELDNIDHPRPDGNILAWVDVHGRDVNSYWPGTYKVAVDLVAQLEPVGPTTSSPDSRHRDPPSWNRVIIPGKVQQHKYVWDDVIKAHLAYSVRQIYKEQPDRRFVFGMTFESVYLTVWYFDRSGALGSEVVDVHQSPLILIQFLLGCARMPAVDFGFDPTFLWFKDGSTHLPSYQIPPDVVQGGFETLPWVFEMPEVEQAPKSEKKSYQGVFPRSRKKFVTFRALKMSRPEIIFGQATRVWLAYSLDNFLEALDSRSPTVWSTFQVYVLKDKWHDTSRVAEGKVYRKLGPSDGVARLYSSERVRVFGEVDKTKRARKGMGIPLWSVGKTSLEPDHSDPTNFIHFKEPNRTHYRVLLQSFGYSLTDFLSQEELLTVFIDVINGHKHMVDAGYLHRDVSSGNILITDKPSPNRGILIDQEYAIPAGPEYEWSEEEMLIGTPPFVSLELLIRGSFYSMSYSTPPRLNRTLGIVEGIPTEPREWRPRVVHDLESFFWVLCWICVMLDGPCTRRSITEDDDHVAWRNLGNLFNEKKGLGASAEKVNIMVEDILFSRIILKNLSPFFHFMGPLLRRLRKILIDAYAHTNDDCSADTLHRDFVAALQDRLEELKTRPDPLQSPYDKAKARRRVTRMMKTSNKSNTEASNSEGEKQSTKEQIAEAIADITTEKEASFKMMVSRAEERRASFRFHMPPQFLDRVDIDSENDGDDRPRKRPKIT